MARQFLASALDGAPADVSVIETRLLPAASDPSAGARAALSSFSGIELWLDDFPVGHFVVLDKDPARRGEGSAASFAGTPTVSLLALGAPGASPLEAAFLPLDFEPRSGAEVVLQMEVGGRRVERVLGRAQLLDARANLFSSDAAGVLLGLRWQDRLVLEPSRALDGDELRRARAILVRVDGHPVLRGWRGPQGVELQPLQGKLWQPRAAASSHARVEMLPEEGRVVVVLHGPGESLRVPIARWQRRSLAIPAGPRAPELRVAIEAGPRRCAARRRSRRPTAPSAAPEPRRIGPRRARATPRSRRRARCGCRRRGACARRPGSPRRARGGP